ncbi:HAD family hydrolase [Ectothiorhodospira sp. BSL-9]|uniref:HAD family hydrolase n=1 Tax=Ectothiorhodospira sp. BSL-9 TaxID=1442136 RepID=UPI0007B455D4|nr:HAD family hydrolase [Ectothiorhodospira sp. BSL-9]ANB03054.1 haloacid dehalogenase [Ectothiorhodospira sp. BSL-9]
MNLRCITFDLDDTLWACAPVIQNAERTFHDWLGAHYPGITRRMNLEAMIDHRQRWFRPRARQHHDLSSLRKQWLAALAVEYGYDDALVEPGFRVFWEARNQVSLYDDVLETLDRLRHHYTIGAITNGNADVHYIGIGQYFDFVVTAAGAGHAKPSPEIFTAALDEAAVAAHEALHVGDDPERDVLGAARVGMRTAWVNTHGMKWPGGPGPDLQMPHVGELPGRLLIGSTNPEERAS